MIVVSPRTRVRWRVPESGLKTAGRQGRDATRWGRRALAEKRERPLQGS